MLQELFIYFKHINKEWLDQQVLSHFDPEYLEKCHYEQRSRGYDSHIVPIGTEVIQMRPRSHRYEARGNLNVFSFMSSYYPQDSL